MVIEPHFIEVLDIIREKLNNDDIVWVVAGSCNLALRGLDVRVHDIDLLTDKNGAYAIEELFFPNITRKVEFSTAGKIRSYFGSMYINKLMVDIIGDSQFLCADGSWTPVRYLENCREIMEYDGRPLPLLRLEEEYEGYRYMGRLERAARILKHLKETGA